MRSLISHLRYSIRLLLKSPGFTITAVLILGFGIGLNTAIFSLINAVILKPLPFSSPEQLVQLFMPFQNVDDMPFDYPDYEDIKAAQRSFQELATFTPDDMNLTGRGTVERIEGAFVSPEMFAITGHGFLLGRPFTKDEDKLGGSHIVVLSEKFWRSHFNADRGVIGTTLTISGRALEVIGVAPAQAFESWSSDVYLPIHLMRGTEFNARDRHYFGCLGRLKPGVTLSQAQADVESIHRDLMNLYPTTDKDYRIRLAPLLDTQVDDYAATLWLLGAAVTSLFLIAAANIVNLILARTLDRRKEAAVRTALGASRFHLVGQSLLESACLSFFGAAAGLIFSLLAIEIIRVLSPQDGLARFQDVGFDAETWIFFLGVTILSSFLFGLFPAWTLTEINVGYTLKDDGRAATISQKRQRTQTILVTVQVAFACVLVIAATLLVRSFQITQSVPPGFNPDHVLTARIYLTGAYFPSQPVLGGFIMMMMAILIGVVFGWLRLASGSIWPSVCAHSANAAAYHACGFFGAVEQTNTWPGTMVGGSAHTAHFPNCISHFDQTVSGGGRGSETRSCLVRLICSLDARIDRIRHYANEKIAPQRHR